MLSTGPFVYYQIVNMMFRKQMIEMSRLWCKLTQVLCIAVARKGQLWESRLTRLKVKVSRAEIGHKNPFLRDFKNSLQIITKWHILQ